MRNILLLVVIALTGEFVTAQNRVIDYPVVGKRTTDAIEFYQAEVSDTAIILRGEMYSRPNTWVSIASSSILKGQQTGKKYRLIRATGIQLDKEEYMPASWCRSFTLQFEPIDTRDKSVDFDEMLSKGNGFLINGISLEKKEVKDKIHCRIEGKVVDNPAYSRLMLMPDGADTRVQEWISIPVRDGKFAYDLYTDKEEPYEIYAWSDNLQGCWRPIPFFTENGKVELVLYSMEKDPEIVSDGTLTNELLRFQKEVNDLFFHTIHEKREQLMKADKVETPELKALHEQFEKTENEEERKEILRKEDLLREKGKAYTEEYMALEKKGKEANDKYKAFQNEYIQSKPTLVGLYLLAQNTRSRWNSKDYASYIDIYRRVYENKFSDNLLTDYLKHWIMSNEIKVGGKFIDFTAPDLEGVRHTLSKEIEGKVALVDLWASWCGPCRRTSISMIPVYEAYKEKGFTVVGVARERQVDDMKKAISKDKYPWLNLLELNDAGKIWERYGIGNAGGCTYLLDKEGKILAIHPTVEEVKEWLDKLLR